MKSEKALSEELGMDRKTLRALRMDALSADSWTKESNQIVYTAEGEHELRNVIQRKLASEALSPPLEEKEPKMLTITKIPLNRKMVICDEIRVRVSSNKNFLRGMQLKARPPVGDNKVWVMVGRCPRWRGRW